MIFLGLVSPTPLISGMISPPPMLVPTPISGGQISMLGPGGYPSITSPMLMGQGIPSSTGGDVGAVAFTYVPVPMYNMAGLGMAPQMGVLSPSSAPDPPKTKPKGTSTPLSASSANTSQTDPIQGMSAAQMAYQQAFLQNAVAQNMQIQQQLMMQNQALSQLLNQSGGILGPNGQNSWQSSGANSSMTTMVGTPMPSIIPGPGFVAQMQATSSNNDTMSEAHRRASMEQLLDERENFEMDMKQRSMSTPNTPKHSDLQIPPQAPSLPKGCFKKNEIKNVNLNTNFHLLELLGNAMDPYTRARTVRIGKWRWPPPKEELAEAGVDSQNPEGFFEFKMRKMQVYIESNNKKIILVFYSANQILDSFNYTFFIKNIQNLIYKTIVLNIDQLNYQYQLKANSLNHNIPPET